MNTFATSNHRFRRLVVFRNFERHIQSGLSAPTKGFATVQAFSFGKPTKVTAVTV
jgi:hypothetical protein